MEPMEVADVTEASSTSGDVARSALASPDAAVDAALATASSEKNNLLERSVDEMEIDASGPRVRAVEAIAEAGAAQAGAQKVKEEEEQGAASSHSPVRTSAATLKGARAQ